MIFHPTSLALVFVSVASGIIMLYSSAFGYRVIRYWDINSGSELQIELEKKTYLISTFLSFVCVLQIVSLLLYMYYTDSLAQFFTGAMCAVGVLNVNAFGMPVLGLKLLLFFLSSLWLMMNILDTQAPDYPLTKVKYVFLMLMTPIVLVEMTAQYLYFTRMNPNVITSCCGTLFSGGKDNLPSELADIDPGKGVMLFISAALLFLINGLVFRCWLKGGRMFFIANIMAFTASIIAIISFISLYVYEHPHHHCPFCVLQREYYYQGYLLYIPLFAAIVFGLGSAMTAEFKNRPSLTRLAARFSKKLSGMSLFSFLLFLAVVIVLIMKSHLILLGG